MLVDRGRRKRDDTRIKFPRPIIRLLIGEDRLLIQSNPPQSTKRHYLTPHQTTQRYLSYRTLRLQRTGAGTKKSLKLTTSGIGDHVCMVTHEAIMYGHTHSIARVCINRIRLLVLHVVSCTGKTNISLSTFVPENLVSRDGFGSPVPRQPVHLHTRAESGAYSRDASRFPRRRPSIPL